MWNKIDLSEAHQKITQIVNFVLFPCINEELVTGQSYVINQGSVVYKHLLNVDDDISQLLRVFQRVFDVFHDYLKEALGDKLTPDAAQGFKLITTAFTATVAKEYEVIANQPK